MRSRRGAYDSSDVDVRWQVPLRSEASHSFWADRSSQGWQSGLPTCIAENFVFVHAICPWLLEAASPTATSIFLPFTNFSWVPLNQSDVASRDHFCGVPGGLSLQYPLSFVQCRWWVWVSIVCVVHRSPPLFPSGAMM